MCERQKGHPKTFRKEINFFMWKAKKHCCKFCCDKQQFFECGDYAPGDTNPSDATAHFSHIFSYMFDK